MGVKPADSPRRPLLPAAVVDPHDLSVAELHHMRKRKPGGYSGETGTYLCPADDRDVVPRLDVHDDVDIPEIEDLQQLRQELSDGFRATIGAPVGNRGDLVPLGIGRERFCDRVEILLSERSVEPSD